MPVTRCAIIYSISPRGVMEHCCVVPELDDAEIANIKPPPNHDVLYVPCVDNGWRMGAPVLDARQKLIAEHSGLPLAPMTCAVIENISGKVVNVINADMALHRVDGHTLVNHPSPKHGDIWDGSQLSRRFVAVDPVTGVVASEVTVPVDSLDFSQPLGPQLAAASSLSTVSVSSVSESVLTADGGAVSVVDAPAWLADPEAAVGEVVTPEEGDWHAPVA